MPNSPSVMRRAVSELQAKLGNVRVDESSESERKAVSLVERSLPARYADNLTPPIDASYWRTQSFTPMYEQQLIADNLLIGHCPVETLTWRVEAHVYVVNAIPDANFSRNGGAIYVVLVHGGSAVAGSAVGGGMQYRYTVSLKSSGAAVKQLPSSNSGVHSGDDWNYPISFCQGMQMFKNGGNDTFSFQASYEDSIDVHKGEQTGFVYSGSSVQWGIVLEDYPEFRSNFPFGALSVFKFDSLDQVTFECKASVCIGSNYYVMASEMRSITVNCKFSA